MRLSEATPKIKLIGTAASRVVRNVWMLAELGLPYEHDPIAPSAAEMKQPPYLDWNPNAKVPICIVDGFALWESLAINLYLDRRFPSAISLITLEEQAQGMQWSLWALTEVEMNTFNWYIHTILKPEAERDTTLAAECLEKLQRPLAVLEKTLTGRACLLGERFTVADLTTAATMYRALWLPLEDFPNVKGWIERCWSREGALIARRARGDKV